MGRITAGLFVSLDGVAEAPEKWHLDYFDDELDEVVGASLTAAGTLLLGRRTYQEWEGFWPEQTGELADYMNRTPKLVVSTTLDSPRWQPVTVIREHPATELARLKQDPGTDLGVNGSITLVRWLLRERLLDELVLLVHPIVLGAGARWFGEGDRAPLRLAESRTLGSGVVALTYHPAGR